MKAATSKQRRPRRRHAGLDEAKIVSAAGELIRRSGVSALSMRTLARELGVVPMSIYHHVRNKDVLLDRVVDFILAPIPTPTPRRDAWAEQVKAYTMAGWEALGSCPGLSDQVLKRTVPTPGSQRLLYYAYTILREAGFDERMAALGVATYHSYVFGLLKAEAFFEGSAAANTRARKKRPRGAKPSNNPLAGLTARAFMEYGIDTALAGLRHMLDHAAKAGTIFKVGTGER